MEQETGGMDWEMCRPLNSPWRCTVLRCGMSLGIKGRTGHTALVQGSCSGGRNQYWATENCLVCLHSPAPGLLFPGSQIPSGCLADTPVHLLPESWCGGWDKWCKLRTLLDFIASWKDRWYSLETDGDSNWWHLNILHQRSREECFTGWALCPKMYVHCWNLACSSNSFSEAHTFNKLYRQLCLPAGNF